MYKSKFLNFSFFDHEIERTLQRIRKQKANTSTTSMANPMEENKPLRDYAMSSINGSNSSIRRPIIQANHFEIKSPHSDDLADKVQFGRLS